MRTGRMTMSSLRYRIGGTEEMLLVMVSIIEAIDGTMDAGEKIDILRDFSNSQNGEIKTMCVALSEAGFAPMGQWLLDVVFNGSVESDVYNEFFISESLEKNDTVPNFLIKVVDNAISCARNARILSDMGIALLDGVDRPEVCSMESNMIISLVQKKLRSSDNTLFKSVSTELNNSIEKMCKVFFISQSDWFMDFYELSSIELEKSVKLINKTKMNEWLRSALDDDCMQIEFHSFQLDQMNQREEESTEEMMGLRAVTIDWKRRKLPLIFTESIVMKLQCIFRHIFYCKSVDLKLSQLWLEFQSVRQFENGSLISSNLLLQEMNHFVKNYLFYLSIDVIESKMTVIKNGLNLSTHQSIFTFSNSLDSVLSEIISEFNLTTSVFKLLSKVLSTCALFSAHIRRFLALQPLSESMAEVTQQERYISMFEKFRDAFQGQMNSLLVQLKMYQRTSSGNLIARLDFNEYFSEVMGI